MKKGAYNKNMIIYSFFYLVNGKKEHAFDVIDSSIRHAMMQVDFIPYIPFHQDDVASDSRGNEWFYDEVYEKGWSFIS